MTASTNDGAGAAGSPGSPSSSDGRDDLDDDLQLRSMRAVWLSMRDEEPPEGGLAALMAAARAKAEELQPQEPWWRRALAGLLRPQALALATVVVLLGGAIVISGRRDALESTPMVASEEARGAGAGEAALGSQAADTGTAAESAAAPAAAAPEPASVAEGAEPAPDVAATPADARPKRPAGKAVAGPRTAPRDRAADGDAFAAESKRDFARAPDTVAAEPPQAAPPQAAPPPPPAVAPVQPAPPKGARVPEREPLAIADEGDAAEPRTNAPGGTAAASAGGGTQIQGAGRAAGPTLEQLAKQSQAAAARGDCAAVRAIAGKIRQLDAAFHKAHLDGNAAVRRCVK